MFPQKTSASALRAATALLLLAGLLLGEPLAAARPRDDSRLGELPLDVATPGRPCGAGAAQATDTPALHLPRRRRRERGIITKAAGPGMAPP